MSSRKWILVLLSLVVVFISCQNEDDVVTSLKLSPTALQLTVGEMATLEASGGTNIEWVSSDESVATVYHGVVTAKAVGATTITIRSGKRSANCEVFVLGTDGSSLRITPVQLTMNAGETYQLKCSNAYPNFPVTWSSSDKSVATVDNNGLVTAVSGGNARITVSTDVGKVQCLVTVRRNWGDYKLVWSDEFNGTTLDQNVWTIQTGTGNWGWGNDEKQYYTGRSQNLRVEGGYLIIEAKKESYSGSNYTSARIMSQGKKEFKYGRMEASISVPSGGGLWPAFWMLGQNIGSVGWPTCGEIDIMEYVGNHPNVVLGTLHTKNNNGGNGIGYSHTTTGIADNFHIYGVEWVCEEKNGRDVIRFYIDDKVYGEATETVIDDRDSWPFNQPFYFILNLAVGGNLGGAIDDNIWSTQRMMKVDWVRVYQRSEE